MFPRWWQRRLLSRSRSSGRKTPAGRFAPGLERLEDRTVPSFAAPAALDLPAALLGVATGHFAGTAAPPGVVTADANGTVSVLLGKADGTLQVPINIHVGGTTDAVAVGDLLGSGLDDIVTANADGTVNVLLSNGNGTFGAPQSFTVGAGPLAVTVGNFLGHGRLDVATANTNGTVTVLPGNGDGTFAAPITTQVGGRITSLAVGDFNQDGAPDLVVGNDTGVTVLLGTGTGAFQVGQTVPVQVREMGFVVGSGVRHVAAGDFRGNGTLDVLADGNLLLGNGNGTFGSPVALGFGGQTVLSTAIGDFNGDGTLDIVSSNAAPPNFGGPSISLLAGNGDGTFAAPVTIPFGGTASALAAADFNGDGKLDLAGSFTGNTASVLLNTGGTFATAPAVPAGNAFPTALAAGAFTRGGKPDLVATGLGGVVVELNNGDGTFRVGPTLPIPNDFPSSVVVGDFNRDGNLDVTVGTQGGKIDVFLGHGDGTFGAAKVFNIGSSNSIRSVVVGDFNRDGRLDVAVTSTLLSSPTQAGVVTILLGNGNGTFLKGATIPVGTLADGVAAADLNGDGKLDLVTTTLLAGGLRDVKVLLGNGNGTFGRPIAISPGAHADSVAVGDFTGDGKPDLALVDRFTRTVLILPGNGNGTFGSSIPFQFNNPGSGLGGPVVGDFFRTGKLSLAVTTGVSTVSVLQGNGDGTFQAPVNFITGFHGTQPSGLVAADFNGDGTPDLATANTLSGDVSVLLNTTAPVTVTAPVATATSLAADISSAVFGQPVTLTATVTSSGGTPTGTATFLDGTTVLGRVAVDPNGRATLTLPLGVGVHSLRASFAGTGAFAASTSASLGETVNRAATTSTLSANTVGIPGLLHPFVVLTATVVPVAPGAGVPTGTVTIFDGTTVLGTGTLDANGQFFLDVATFTAGHHHLRLVYGGDGNFTGSTGTLDVNL